MIKNIKLMIALSPLLLTGCVGMNAPYGASENKTDYELIPVTADLIMQLALEASNRPENPPIAVGTATGSYRYLIKPGDELLIGVPSIVSFNSANSPSIIGEQGQSYLVYDDGTIYLPFSGSIVVAGLSLKEAQEAVVKALSGYLRAPQVVVTVKEFRSQRIMITGQVEKPGYLPITDVPMTLIGALSTAGGILERRGGNDPRPVGAQLGQQQVPLEYPDLRHVTLKRGGVNYVVDANAILASGDIALDPVLLDGDVVVVPSFQRANIFVIGEVTRPGLLEVDKNDTNLAGALMSSGGVNQMTANPSRIYVIRGDYKHPDIYQVDAGRPDAMLLAQKFTILPNDVIYVSEAGATRWNRALQQILPTVQGLLSTAIVANTVDDLKNDR
jgi:polysaccharide export outer membrane protein